MHVGLASGPVVDLAVDVLVLFETEQDGLSPLAAQIDARIGGRIERARGFKELTGKLCESAWLHAEGTVPAPRVLVVGLGKRDELTPERMRRAAATAARQLGRRDAASATFALSPDSDAALLQAVGDGVATARFDTGVYKSASAPKGRLEDVQVGVVEGVSASEWAPALQRGLVIGDAANCARGLALQPGNRLTPTLLADEASRLATKHGLEVEVLGQPELEQLGAGALLGVAQGSVEPPCLIVLRYRSGRDGGPVLALVGKGVTFDSGGISIKSAQGMQDMKYDMSGAAAVLGAMQAIAQLRPSLDVIGVVPATENLISGRAMKPGDVLTAMNGTTIEVVNTDAEGRLILADAIVYAHRQGATHVVDAATLTGGVVTALGHAATGLFGRPDEWVARVQQAAARAGDRVWHLPLFPEYREQLKSDVADIMNSGGRNASPSTGAMFIREFVPEDVSWAHLDIAGTAYTGSDKAWQPAGPTAAGMRLMVELALEMGGPS